MKKLLLILLLPFYLSGQSISPSMYSVIDASGRGYSAYIEPIPEMDYGVLYFKSLLSEVDGSPVNEWYDIERRDTASKIVSSPTLTDENNGVLFGANNHMRFNELNLGTQHSIRLRFKIQELGTKAIISKSGGTSYFVFLGGTNELRYKAISTITILTGMQDETIYDLMIVRDGANLKVYNKFGNIINELSTGLSADFLVNQISHETFNFSGGISRVGLYDRVLDSSEIVAIMEDKPVQYWGVIEWGQSNMEGFFPTSNIAGDLTGAIDNTYVYRDSEGISILNATEVNNNQYFPANRYGLEMRFAKEWKEKSPYGRDLIQLKVSKNSTGLDEYWKIGEYGFGLLHDEITSIKANISDLRMDKFLSYQGERDALDSLQASLYETNFTAFIDSLEILAGNNFDAAFYMITPIREYSNVVNNALKSVAESNVKYDTISTYYAGFPYQSDTIHLNGIGYGMAGEAAYNKLFE